ncbi:hypothetical protein ABPG74_017328 [Tetrahymena malaccensis]
MSYTTRRFIDEKEKLEYSRGYNQQELEASKLRKDFVKKYIVDFDTTSYKTQVERDWAYIAKREYRYEVQLKSIGYGGALANAVLLWRIYANKKMVFWPIPIVGALGYLYFQPVFFQKSNKRFFDMCNVGEEYYLGRERNRVLRECNKILNVEDF